MKKFLCLLALLLSGCETIVQIDLPEHQSRLVVDGIFEANERWQIGVSRSVGILGNEFPGPVENATVEIWRDGQLLTALNHADQGIYVSASEIVEIGKTYELRIAAPGFDPVSATAVAPDPVSLDSITYTVESIPFGGQRVNFSVQFNDDPAQKNYYEIFVLTRDFDGGWFNNYFSSTDPAIVETNTSIEIGEEREFAGEIALFDDALFDGETYDLSLRYYPWFGYQEVLVVLNTVTENVYLHNRAMELQEETDDNPFAEPVQHYSNIANGYGIFGGVNPVSRRFVFNFVN